MIVLPVPPVKVADAPLTESIKVYVTKAEKADYVRRCAEAGASQSAFGRPRLTAK